MELDNLLSELADHVKGELSVNPEIEEKSGVIDLASLPIVARRWWRILDVVAVVADLKGSTSLISSSIQPASMAAIYEAATGGLTDIFPAFDADFISIQGDGAFGLFWGEHAFERAICAGITIKTFSKNTLVPKLNARWPGLPETGFKVGIASSDVLVKRVGQVGNKDNQEPVWSGNAVNYASKCAQLANAHELIVTGSVWDAATCNCGSVPNTSLWKPITIEKIGDGSGENSGQLLTSGWCDKNKHGQDFCTAILNGDTYRSEVAEMVNKSVTASRRDEIAMSLKTVRQQKKASLDSRRRGLADR
jgi:class 3 adenylate cyclase